MAAEVSENISDINDFISLCQKHGWDPLFLDKDDMDFKWDHLSRELKVCRASGMWELCGDLVKAAKKAKVNVPVENISKFEKYSPIQRIQSSSDYSWHDSLPGRHHLFVRRRVAHALRSILSDESLEPQVFCFDQKADFAEQWGMEMKHWNIQQKHELVVSLGESASSLNLAHPMIAQCLEDSTLVVKRANKLIVLKAIQQSPFRSRSDYEKSVLKAWSLDPDYDVYVDLLRKIVAFRLRHKKQHGLLMEEFSREIIDFEVNKKLVRHLMHA